MFTLDKTKLGEWLTESCIGDLEDYLKDKTVTKKGDIYYFNFENFLLRKKYLRSAKE